MNSARSQKAISSILVNGILAVIVILVADPCHRHPGFFVPGTI